MAGSRSPLRAAVAVSRLLRAIAAIAYEADAEVSELSSAQRSAARASERVESSVGSGEFVSLMINGISVQPSTTASAPRLLMRSMTARK
jgi:hypothetical protein